MREVANQGRTVLDEDRSGLKDPVKQVRAGTSDPEVEESQGTGHVGFAKLDSLEPRECGRQFGGIGGQSFETNTLEGTGEVLGLVPTGRNQSDSRESP